MIKGGIKKVHNDILTIGSITIHGYGLMIALGFITALLMGSYRAKKQGLDPDAVSSIAMLLIICGFLGAKLLYIVVEFEAFMKDPISVLGSEGFVVYGGIIVGALTGLIYCRRKKLDCRSYFDLLMPSVALAQGFGRIGCFLAGCCYGRETHSAIGIIFPEGSLAPAGVKLLPTQLISSVGDFAIAGILLWFSSRSKCKGNTGALYLLLYGVGRFTIEFLRNDERGIVGMLSTSQFISIFFVIGAVVLFIMNKKNQSAQVVEASGDNS